MILVNDNLTYKALFKKIIEQNKQHTLLIPISNLLLYAIGFLGNALRFIKIKISMSSANLAILRINNFLRRKAKNKLNTSLTPIDEVIEEAIQCFNGR